MTAEVAKDAGAFGASTNSVAEKGDGFYQLTLTAAEMNADVVAVKLTSAGCTQQNLVFYPASGSLTGIEDIKGTGFVKDTDSLVQIREFVEAVKKIESNRWKIVGNQLVIYDDDGVTPLLTFDLKNKAGNPTDTSPYERVPT